MTHSLREQGQVPEWNLTDRLRKALTVADLYAMEMAEYLDVSRSTVAKWLHGEVAPRTQTLRLWAMRTGVPFEWLRTGNPPPPTMMGGPDDHLTSHDAM